MARRRTSHGVQGRREREPPSRAGALAAPAGRAQTPRWLDAALDVLALTRAEPGVPLERMLTKAVRARALGSHERRQTGDAVFAWARRRASIEARLAGAVGARLTPRERDHAAVLAACAEAGLEPFAAEDPEDAGLDAAAGVAGEAVRVALEVVLALPAPATLPPWLGERLTDPALRKALGVPALPVLAVDPRRATAAEVCATFPGAVLSQVVPDAVRLARRAAIPPALRHAVWPMDDASQAVALAALPDRADDTVLDACAGGGGKTRLLVSRGARVVAADVSLARLVRGVGDRAPSVVADGRMAPFAPRSFARVLIDAPCSGTGTLRRHPDLAHRLRPEDVPRFVELQHGLVRACLALVRPGGVLVYATCSLLPEENDAIIDAVLTAGLAVPQPLEALWRGLVRAGLAPSAARAHFSPSTHGTDGFFVAALRVPGG